MFSSRVTDRVVERLALAGCVAPVEEAGELLRSAGDEQRLREWVTRREQGEPLAWITGQTTFCGRSLRVDPGVYVPRPQTEQLVERAAALLPARGRAVDLCTGCGAIAAHLAAAKPVARVVAADIDPRCVHNARANGVAALVADLGTALRGGAFDVVTAVTPYVPTGELGLLPADVQRYEPRPALDGGVDGLRFVRRLAATAARLLRAGGWLLTEIGGSQDRVVATFLSGVGFDRYACWYDDDGDLRGVAAQKPRRS